jgi:hypothetical protein
VSAVVASPLVRQGAVAAAAVAALVLLLIFHSVVAGAVQRAAQRRNDAAVAAVSMNAARVAAGARSTYFQARKVSLARVAD